MILLDTNVVLEALRPTPNARVIEWIDAQLVETLFLSAITAAKLRLGVALMPAGKRKAGLLETLKTRVLPLFVGRVLPLAANRLVVATRDVNAFEAAGLTVINPWPA